MAAVLLTCLLGAALAQDPAPNEHSYNGADCYACHRAWSPVPMRTMFNLAASAEPTPVGSILDLGVNVQQAWLGAPPWPKLVHFEASLDLSNAPSLGFVSQDPPVLGVQSFGQIEPLPQPLSESSGDALIQIPVGTSDLTITLAANTTDPILGPDLALRLYPGKERSIGTEWYQNATFDSAGPGQPEVLRIQGHANITALGSEPFALEAILRPTLKEQGISLERRTIPFTVTLDAYRNTTGEQRQFLIADRLVEAGGATILSFQVLPVATPGPGESIRMTVSSTANYPHESGGGRDDYGNISKTTTVPVLVQGGAVIFGEEAGPATVAVGPDPIVQLDTLSETIGYLSAFLLIASILSGGMFGRASRRAINHLFQGAKRRVAFHNFLSYFLTLAAAVHTVLFIVETNHEWTLGILWGGIAILSMLLLGITGAWQVAIIRRWSFPTWRWTHFGLAIAAILFTVVHLLLDGAHFGSVQNAVGWDNPFPDPRDTRA